MGTRAQAQQQRRKWADGLPLAFSQAAASQVSALAAGSAGAAAAHNGDAPFQRLAAEVLRLSQSSSGADVKPLIAIFQTEMARGGGFGGDVQAAVGLLLEVLFADNSAPWHRDVLTALKKSTGPQHHGAVAGALVALVAREAGEASQAQQPPQREARASLALGQALTSLIAQLPLFQQWVAPAVTPAVRSVAHSILAVLNAASGSQGTGPAGDDGRDALQDDAPQQQQQQHLAPSQMAAVQDGISALYYLIAKHGDDMAARGGEAGRQALVRATEAMLLALRGEVLVREAMASAAVVVWMACACPHVAPERVVAQLAQGLFLAPEQLAAGCTVRAAACGEGGQPLAAPPATEPHEAVGAVEQALRDAGTTLAEQVARCSLVGKVCMVRGLLNTVPAPAMCWPLHIARQPGPEGSAREAPLAAAAEGGAQGSRPLGAPQPGTSWTFLVEGALMWSVQQVQVARDGHLKYQAACAVSACVRQLLGRWQAHNPAAHLPAQGNGQATQQEDQGEQQHTPEQAGPDDSVRLAPPPPLLSPEALESIMEVLWANMDDAVSYTQRQLQETFDMALELIQWQQRLAAGGALAGPAPTTSKPPAWLSVEDMASRLLRMPVERKGRYMRLRSLVPHVGALRLLELHPPLVRETIHALTDMAMSSAAATLLKVLLERLRAECLQAPPPATSDGPATPAGGTQVASSSGGAEDAGGGAQDVWQRWWLPDLLAALLSGNERLRVSVSVQALPVVLSLDPSALRALIRGVVTHAAPALPEPPAQPASAAAAGEVPDGTAALISVLRAARQLQLVAGLDALAGCKRALGVDIVQVLLAAIVHSDESVRADCLELVATNPKQAEAPARLEVQVAARWLACCLRATSPGLRNRCIALVHKLMARLQTAAAACVHRAGNLSAGATGGRFAGALRGRATVPVLGLVRDADAADAGAPVDGIEASRRADAATLALVQGFCQWACTTMTHSMYPGAPFERKYLAIETLNAVLSAWPLDAGAPAPQPAAGVSPYPPAFFTPHVVQLLLSNAIDSWAKLRESAAAALMRFPAPWPGLGTGAALQPLLCWAYQLLCSPKLREADAGARMLKLVFAKYVRGLGWHIRLGPRVSVQQPHGAGAAASAQASGQHGAALAPAQLLEATQVFLHSLLDVVEAQCELATEPEASASLPGGGLLQACRSSFAHGPLLLTRYVVEDAPWADLAASSPAAPRTARALVARALALLQRTAGLCVPPLTAPTAGVGAEDADEAEFADGGALAEEAEGEGGGGPDAQMVLTGCWLTAKEVALLAGALVHALPLEEEAPGGGAAAAAGAAEGGVGGAWLLGVGQVHEVGRLLVSTVMLEVRHTGVLDKAAAALTLVVDKLLRSTSAALNQQPQELMQLCMNKMVKPGQTLDDIVRRSGGLPLAVCAVLAAEPGSSSKAMLTRTMQQVLAVAQRGAPAFAPAPGQQQQPGQALSGGDGGDGVPEPIPRVHAFNVLRAMVASAQLAMDTGAYLAQSMQVCVTCLSDPAWEVRNGATVCFTALSVRLMGFKNMAKWEVPKRAVAGVEFFVRFPSLHAFLLEQLTAAVTHLERDAAAPTTAATTTTTPGTATSATVHLPNLHTSLFPVLLILSRLRPWPPLEAMPSLATQAPSPAVFAPWVHRLAVARHYAVRELAARALVPLVPPERLPHLLLLLLAQLPGARTDAACLAARQALAPATAQQQPHALPASASASAPAGSAWPPLAAQPGAVLPLSSNALQGLLLQLEAVLQSNVLPGHVDAALAVVAPHLELLLQLARPGAAQPQPPAAILLLIVRVSHAALSLMRPPHCRQHAQLLQRMARTCHALLAPPPHAGPPVDFGDPMAGCLHKHAARLWVGLSVLCGAAACPSVLLPPSSSGGGAVAAEKDLVQSWGGDLVGRLQQCLASPNLDTRAGAAKALATLTAALQRHTCGPAAPAGLHDAGPSAALRSRSEAGVLADQERWAGVREALLSPEAAGAHTALLRAVQALAWRHLAEEPSFKVRKRLLRALCATHSCLLALRGRGGGAATERAGGGGEGALAPVAVLLGLLRRAGSVEERAEALRCLGQQVHHQHLLTAGPAEAAEAQVDGSSAAAEATDELQAFCSQLEGGAEPTQPSEVRLAAADALDASGLLHWRPSPGGQWQGPPHPRSGAALRGWLVALTLTEDEDEGVRQRVTGLLQPCVAGTEGSGGGGVRTAPVHTEGLQRAVVFEVLPARFGADAPALASALCGLVVRAKDPVPAEVQQAAAAAARSADPQQQQQQQQGRIFDAELDNQHEEPLFVAQLAARQLRGAVEAGGGLADAAEQMCEAAVQRVLGELQQVVDLSPAPPASSEQGAATAGVAGQQLVQQPGVWPYVSCRLLLLWALAPVWRPRRDVAAAVEQAVAGLLRSAGGDAPSGPLGALLRLLRRECGGQAADADADADVAEQEALFLLEDGACFLAS